MTVLRQRIKSRRNLTKFDTHGQDHIDIAKSELRGQCPLRPVSPTDGERMILGDHTLPAMLVATGAWRSSAN